MQCTLCTYRKQISMLEKTAIHQEDKVHTLTGTWSWVLWYLCTAPLNTRLLVLTVPLTFPMQIFFLSGIYVCTESMRNDFPSLQGLGFSFQRHISVSSCLASLTLNKPKMWSLILAKWHVFAILNTVVPFLGWL